MKSVGHVPTKLASHLQWLVCTQKDVRRIQRRAWELPISSLNVEEKLSTFTVLMTEGKLSIPVTGWLVKPAGTWKTHSQMQQPAYMHLPKSDQRVCSAKKKKKKSLFKGYIYYFIKSIVWNHLFKVVSYHTNGLVFLCPDFGISTTETLITIKINYLFVIHTMWENDIWKAACLFISGVLLEAVKCAALSWM